LRVPIVCCCFSSAEFLVTSRFSKVWRIVPDLCIMLNTEFFRVGCVR
jgi:hypothetical protein